MGERKRKLKEVVVAVKQATDELAHHSAPMSGATAMGQIAFFAEFLVEIGNESYQFQHSGMAAKGRIKAREPKRKSGAPTAGDGRNE